MLDKENFVKTAHAFHALRAPVLRSAIHTLQLLAESRGLDAGCGIGPLGQDMKPASHFLRSLGWLRSAGLAECMARTFVGDAHAPLPDDLRSAMRSLFDMRWPGVERELPPAEWADYQRLCRPASPDFILNHPDYYAFFTYSMFHGKVAG